VIPFNSVCPHEFWRETLLSLGVAPSNIKIVVDNVINAARLIVDPATVEPILIGPLVLSDREIKQYFFLSSIRMGIERISPVNNRTTNPSPQKL
jgi:hypothetical protein